MVAFSIRILFFHLFVAAMLLGFSGERAQADYELFGICFVGTCEGADEDDAELIDPKRYAAEITVLQDDSTDIEGAIKAVSELWRGRDRPVGGSAGLINRAKSDYQRIQAALYDQGHYAGTISITVNGRQASALKPGYQLPDKSSVIIRVEAGTVFRFGTTNIQNAAPTDVPKHDKVELPKDIGFAPDGIAKAGTIRRAGILSREGWRQLGHPLARISRTAVTAVHPDHLLDVHMVVDPGTKADFGPISVSGTELMDPEFVVYMTGLIPGQEYDPDDIERAKKRLDRLGVFSTKQIKEAAYVTPDGQLPLDVIVRENKLRRFGVGATLSSIDGAGVEAYWLHRNLFGKAERVKFRFGVTTPDNSFNIDQFEYVVGGTFTKPGVFNPDTDLIFDVYAMRESNDTYSGPSAGSSLLFTSYVTEDVTLTGGGFAEASEFTDVLGTRKFFVAGARGEAVFDNRRTKIEPIEGIYGRLAAIPFYEFERGNPAARFEGDARTYLSLGSKGQTVIAGRVLLGSLVGPSIHQTPSNMLFTAGGGGTIRGFGYKSIGVESRNGDVVGGRSLAVGSLEFRQRFLGDYGLVLFADAGTIDSASFPDFSSDIHIGAGVGLRYYTGLGAIRLDVATPVKTDSGQNGVALYVGIGQAF